VEYESHRGQAWRGTLTSFALTFLFLGALLLIVLAGLFLLSEMLSFGGHVPAD
jgi:hypothetical protein